MLPNLRFSFHGRRVNPHAQHTSKRECSTGCKQVHMWQDLRAQERFIVVIVQPCLRLSASALQPSTPIKLPAFKRLQTDTHPRSNKDGENAEIIGIGPYIFAHVDTTSNELTSLNPLSRSLACTTQTAGAVLPISRSQHTVFNSTHVEAWAHTRQVNLSKAGVEDEAVCQRLAPLRANVIICVRKRRKHARGRQALMYTLTISSTNRLSRMIHANR
eukprot:6174562-Pleurochrysis_carterae.AAC.2